MTRNLTTEEVADLLRVSPDRVRRFAQSGELPYIRIGGDRGPLTFRPATVEAFIASREHHTQPTQAPRVLDDIRRRRKQTA